MFDSTDLNLMFWNADGIHKKLHELLNLLLDKSIDILAVSETRLTNAIILDTPGYTCYRQDKHPSSGKGQGVAIFIKSNIHHSCVLIPETKYMEAIGIELSISSHKYVIVSAYQSPNLDFITNDLDITLGLGPKVLVMGDFNARHTLWDCDSINKHGTCMLNHMLVSDFVIHAPDSPTLIHYRSEFAPSTPDLCLSKNVDSVLELFTLPALSSNHLPVIFTLYGSLKRDSKIQFNYSEADWSNFRSFLNENTVLSASVYSSIPELDAAIGEFLTNISTARNMFIPKINAGPQTKPLPRFIKKLIKQKNNLRRQEQHESSPVSRKILRTSINQLQDRINVAIKCNQDNIWNKRLNLVDNPSSDIWKLVRSLSQKSSTIPPLNKPDGSITVDTQEQCNELAEAFHQNMLLTNKWATDENCIREVEDSIKKLNEQSVTTTTQPIHFIHPKELWKQIRSLKCRKSPGPDSIPNIILKNLPHKCIVLLTKILNGCLNICYYPSSWKIAKVIAIRKSGKSSFLPGSYRPISLLCTLGKVFERLILSRLSRYAEDHLISEQFGFRRGHSTVQQLARVAEHIADNLNRNCTTGMFLLDIEKAFDTVWHEGLLHKLLKIGVPIKLVKLMQSYLNGRHFRVHIGSSYSSLFRVPAGVPQGSVLGPYLFLIYLNDIPKQPRTHLACFADDTASFSSSDDIELVVARLQLSLELLSEYFKRWKLKLNDNKTEAILFTRKRELPRIKLSLNGHNIPWSHSVKYLGVILDPKVKWSPHIKSLHDKGMKCLSGLRPLLNRQSNLSPYTKLRIYKSLVRPVITYAAPVWSSTSDTNFSKLQVVQNKALKIAYNTPYYTNLKRLHDKIELLNIQTFVYNLARRFYLDKNPHHRNNLVSSIGKSRLSNLSYIGTYRSYRLPHHYVLSEQ